MSLIYHTLTLITFILLAIDSFFYPTFTLQHFGVDSVLLFVYFIASTCILAGRRILWLPKNFENIHQKFIFPILVIITLIFFLIEELTYDNFVFSHFHFHPFLFVYLPILSGVVIFTSHLKINKEFQLFFFAPPIFFFLLYVLSLTYGSIFASIVKEDNLLEYMQFIFFLTTSIFSFKIFITQKSKHTYIAIMFLLFSIFVFFVAGEEISWGQRILGIQTPQYIEQVNAQDEITVHNLYPFQYIVPLLYIFVGIYGAFSRSVVETFFKKNKHLVIFTPPYFLFFCFFILALFYYQNIFGLYMYTTLTKVSSNTYPQNWQEAIETFFAFGLFGSIYSLYRTLSSSRI